jgi:hypothetical protein
VRLPLAVPIAFGAALGVTSTAVPIGAGDSDVFWHLATAREAISAGIVRSDAFSWTVRGAPLSVDQWLGQLLLYAGYAVGEWRGVLAVRALAVALLIALVVAAAMLRRPARPLLAIVAAFPALLLSRFVWSDRPELFGFVCFAALVLLLQIGSGKALVLIAPLLVLWANLHGSFALGAALTLLVGAYGIATDRARWRPYAVAMAGAVLSFVATPAGLGTLAAPGTHLLDPPRRIVEWAVPDPLTFPGALWALTLGLVVATAALAPRARAIDVLLLVPVAALSMTAARQMPLLAVAAAPFLADRGPEAWTALRSRIGLELRLPPLAAARPLPVAVDVAAAVLAIVALVAAAALGPGEPDDTGRPVAALDALDPGPGLLAHYDWGGWLIWNAPATPVFIDGRLGPYRRAPDGTLDAEGSVLDDYVRIVEAKPGWREIVNERGVRWILVRPADAVAVRAADLGWRVRSASRDHVLIEVSPP